MVADPDGKGHRAATAGLDIAGKTGGAESAPFGATVDEAAKDNGWFVGYAPASPPKRLVAVLVLHSGPAVKQRRRARVAPSRQSATAARRPSPRVDRSFHSGEN